MKVTFFVNSLTSGGAEHQLSILANMLQDRGEDITIATFSDLKDHYELRPGIKRIRIGDSCGKITRLLQIYKFFLTHKTDVFISFCQRSNLISGLFLLASFRKTKYIVGERNFSVSKLSMTEKFLFNVIYRRAFAVVPNSNSQAMLLKNYAPWLRDKIKLITNFTDLTLYKPLKEKKNQNQSGALRFCVIARYESQKNFNRFAQALSILKSQGYKFQADWYGAMRQGSIIRKGYTESKKLADELGLSDELNLNDAVNNVPEILPEYDFFCLPSLFEGFSNALSEAICCGLPVVASNTSDNPVMVKEGENGFLFDPYNIDDMVEALKKMIRLNQSERIEMGVKSRLIAETLFDKETFIKSYLSLLER